MSYVTGKCHVCDTDVIFDEEPYKNPKATRYWRSTYEDVDEYAFQVQRTFPVEEPYSYKNQKQAQKILNTKVRGNRYYVDQQAKQIVVVKEMVLIEHVLYIFCSPECGLKDYEQRRQRD